MIFKTITKHESNYDIHCLTVKKIKILKSDSLSWSNVSYVYFIMYNANIMRQLSKFRLTTKPIGLHGWFEI